MHGCPELKRRCVDFFAEEKNFKKAAVTDGFVKMVRQHPSIIAVIRETIEKRRVRNCEA
jgi:speckle-type POZ protein